MAGLENPKNFQLLWQIPLFGLSQVSTALQALWSYWSKSSARAHSIIKLLLFASVCCFAAGYFYPLGRGWFVVVAVVLGPLALFFHMIWTSLNYEGPPHGLLPPPKLLDKIDSVITYLGEKSNLGN